MPANPSTPGYWRVTFTIESNRLRQLLGRNLYSLVVSTIPDDGTQWDDRRWVSALRAIRQAYASGQTEPCQLVEAALHNTSVVEERPAC